MLGKNRVETEYFMHIQGISCLTYSLLLDHVYCSAYLIFARSYIDLLKCLIFSLKLQGKERFLQNDD